MPVTEGARQSSHLTVNVREGMWGASGRPARSQGKRCQTLPVCPHCALGPWVSLLLVVLVLQGTHLPREATTPTMQPLLQAKLRPRGQPDPGDSQLWAEAPSPPAKVCVSLRATHHFLRTCKGRILERLRVPGHQPSNLGGARPTLGSLTHLLGDSTGQGPSI